ncbi:MAG TPA: prolipoprotein diacylglyceryl transferase [Longimicrobium sp.]|jgi:phosphatidylglycerol:prolipoprotein diacylglycerol transferase
MYPVLIQIGGFTVTSFGVMMALAFLVAGWVASRELARVGLDPEQAWDMVGYAAVFGILGSKIYYMILNWQDTMADPMRALLSRSGLVWYGGLILAAAVIAWRVKKTGMPLGRMADASALALAVGYAIGRMGCFLVGDDYGRPSDLPWAVAFPNGAPPSTAANLREFGVDIPASVPADTVYAVHPTQLYEVGMSLIIFFILKRVQPRLATPGMLFMVWVSLAGVERFIVEIFRAKDDRFLGVLTVAQLISVLLMAAGVAGVAYLARRADKGPTATRRTAAA